MTEDNLLQVASYFIIGESSDLPWAQCKFIAVEVRAKFVQFLSGVFVSEDFSVINGWCKFADHFESEESLCRNNLSLSLKDGSWVWRVSSV